MFFSFICLVKINYQYIDSCANVKLKKKASFHLQVKNCAKWGHGASEGVASKQECPQAQSKQTKWDCTSVTLSNYSF